MSDLWFDGFIAFESTKLAAHYIRLNGSELKLSRYDGIDLFKEESSFKMTSHTSPPGKETMFQNEWIEENGSVGLKIAGSPSNSPSPSAYIKNSKILMVPVEESQTTLLFENQSSLKGASPQIHQSVRDGCLKHKKSVTTNNLVNSPNMKRLILKFTNSAYEASPVNHHKLSLAGKVNEKCTREALLGIEKGTLKVQDKTTDIKKAIFTENIQNGFCKNLSENREQIFGMDIWRNDDKVKRAASLSQTRVRNSEFENLNETSQNRIQHTSLAQEEDLPSCSKKHSNQKIRSTRTGQRNNEYNREFDKTSQSPESSQAHSSDEADNIQLQEMSQDEVFLYCLPDDYDYSTEKEESPCNNRLNLFAEQQLNSGISLAPLSPVKGHLVAKRMYDQYF